MTEYKLPLCAYSIHAHHLSQITDFYSATQMQQAYAAGREAMREEASDRVDELIGNSTYGDAIRSIKI